ncbi:MAG: flavocytochrome c, partial [Solobacterium sp.]|nr:flavocytochrome c [Solobacterium sp.]
MFALLLTVGCSNNTANTEPKEETKEEEKVEEKVSGTFTGEAKGNGGPVTVTVELKDGEIVSVKAEGKDETPGLGVPALDIVSEAITKKNSTDVDTVSGATVTSNAVIEATIAALTEAGLKPEDLVAKEVEEETVADTLDTDIVIVGAGGAGMTAAITAADAGKKVILVEGQAVVGGNTVRSTGGMNAADTEFQDKNEFGEDAGVEKTLASAKESYADNADVMALVETVEKQYEEYKANKEGYFDSVELMELDTLVGGKALNNVELVKVLAEQSANGIAFVNKVSKEVSEDNSGLIDVASFGGASVKRIHRPINAEGKTISVGAYLVPVLEEAVKARENITLLTSTKATKIVKDGDAVVGIEAESDGKTITINAKSVVLATGGFGYNMEMVGKYQEAYGGYVSTNAPGADGSGIVLAEEAGADTVDMEQIQLHPTVHVQDGAASLITEGLRGDGAILVNKEGKRFFDEVSTRDKVSAAEFEQTDGIVWLVVDSRMVEKSAVIQGYINKGFTVTGETYEELAKAMEIDEAAFAETMAKWNENVANKTDEEFGRTSFAEPLDQAPYYALTVNPGVHHTMGGVKINANTEVLDKDGKAIAGLFAAGEVTGGV